MRAQFVVNVENETMQYRTEATDRFPMLNRKIDNETAQLIIDGKLTVKQVVNAIQASDIQSPTFNWREYDSRRRAEKKLWNVSDRNMTPVNGTMDNPAQKDDNASDVVTVADLKNAGVIPGGQGAEGAPAAPPATPKPLTAAEKAAAAMAAPAEKTADKPKEEPAKPKDEPAGEPAGETADGGEDQPKGGARHIKL